MAEVGRGIGGDGLATSLFLRYTRAILCSVTTDRRCQPSMAKKVALYIEEGDP